MHPVEVGSCFSHYLQGFIHPRWLFGISEPSTVWSNWSRENTHTHRKINMKPENTPPEFGKSSFPVPSCSGSIRQSSGVQTIKKNISGWLPGKNFHHPETMDSKLPRTPHEPRYWENWNLVSRWGRRVSVFKPKKWRVSFWKWTMPYMFKIWGVVSWWGHFRKHPLRMYIASMICPCRIVCMQTKSLSTRPPILVAVSSDAPNQKSNPPTASRLKALPLPVCIWTSLHEAVSQSTNDLSTLAT